MSSAAPPPSHLHRWEGPHSRLQEVVSLHRTKVEPISRKPRQAIHRKARVAGSRRTPNPRTAAPRILDLHKREPVIREKVAGKKQAARHVERGARDERRATHKESEGPRASKRHNEPWTADPRQLNCNAKEPIHDRPPPPPGSSQGRPEAQGWFRQATKKR